jgi:hypothetical protein
MEIPATSVDGVDEQHVVEAHLENLWKQKLTWRTNRNRVQPLFPMFRFQQMFEGD